VEQVELAFKVGKKGGRGRIWSRSRWGREGRKRGM
jgi:hypothetical protein